MSNQSGWTGRERSARHDELIDAALSLLAQEGPTSLTMRRLAAELGITTTSIYWHVGGRDSLVDEIIDRTVTEVTAIEPVGRKPQRRLLSLSDQLRAVLARRVHVLALAEERKRSPDVYAPMKVAFAREVERAGLRGRGAASAVDLLRSYVVSFAIFEAAARSHRGDLPATTSTVDDFVHAGISAVTARHLAKPLDFDAVFTAGCTTLVRSLLPDRSV